jgi:hypothetical protein
MKERLIWMIVAIVLVIVILPFHFTYVGFGIAAGLAIVLFDFTRNKRESFDSKYGYWSLIIGIFCLLVAYYVSKNYGISFDELDYDKSFFKLVRGLPFFGITFLTIGVVVITKSMLNKQA